MEGQLYILTLQRNGRWNRQSSSYIPRVTEYGVTFLNTPSDLTSTYFLKQELTDTWLYVCESLQLSSEVTEKQGRSQGVINCGHLKMTGQRQSTDRKRQKLCWKYINPGKTVIQPSFPSSPSFPSPFLSILSFFCKIARQSPAAIWVRLILT